MSGPKGGSYVVVSAEELARRRLAAADAAARTAMTSIAELQARAAALAEAYEVTVSVEVQARPGTTDAQVLEAWTTEAQRAVSVAHAALDRAVTEARSATVASALGVLADLLVAELPGPGDERALAVRRVAAVPDAWRAGAVESASRVAKRLHARCSEADAEVVSVLAAAVIEARSELKARQALDILRNDVSRRNEAHWAQEARHVALTSLLEQLDAWDHPATLELAASLRADGGADASVEQLETRAEAAVAAAVHDRDRQVVSSSIRKSLQSMGYAVEEGFDTLIADRGFAHVRRTGWTDHAVRVRLDADRSEVGLVVVARQGVADDVRDVEVEREWCGSVPGLLEGLAEHGVDLDLQRRTDPGVLPVARLADASFPFAGVEQPGRQSAPRAKAIDG